MSLWLKLLNKCRKDYQKSSFLQEKAGYISCRRLWKTSVTGTDGIKSHYRFRNPDLIVVAEAVKATREKLLENPLLVSQIRIVHYAFYVASRVRHYVSHSEKPGVRYLVYDVQKTPPWLNFCVINSK